MHLEFVRDLTQLTFLAAVLLWMSVLKPLCDLLVLEQFRYSVAENIAVISEHKVKNVTEAAALADEDVLTHKHTFGACG